MSKKFKSQASSARAASSAFGTSTFGAPTAFQTAASPLSYVTELPDLSGVSDPHIVVAYKNLSKKDSVTKAKALEDIQEYLSQESETSRPETAVIEAWINIYPRTSIDNSRRVRQLAHSVQGAITIAAGKRVAPYLNKVVGPWLAGTFDSDKSVSRAAQDALEKSFITKEKQNAIWKLYRTPLVEYAEDAILNQTPQTLSDERTTSPDDAEAKHVRVVGTATLVVSKLLAKAQTEQTVGTLDILAPLLGAKKLWEFAYHSDPYVRRGVCSLVALCAATLPSKLDWSLISTCFLAKSLHISQLGSARQYAEALLAITEAHPAIWTEDYHGKTTASKRLFQYLRQGCHRGPEIVWGLTEKLVREIPLKVYFPEGRPSIDEAQTLVGALHEGVSSPEEPRSNASVAWSTYVSTCFWVADLLEPKTSGNSAEDGTTENASSITDSFLEQVIAPIIYQYVEDSGDTPQWRPPGATALRVTLDCILSLGKRNRNVVIGKIWTRLADHLIDAMKLSLPESSRDFKPSQDAVINKAKRFGVLQAEFVKKNHGDRQLIVDSNTRVVEAALNLLKTRNGKPYGAAGVLPELPMALSVPDDFLLNDLPRLLDSPSADRLVAILLKCRSSPAFKESLKATIGAFVSNVSLRSSPAFHTLLRGSSSKELAENEDLEQIVLEQLQSLLKGASSDWTTVSDVLENQLLRGTAGQPTSEGLPSRVLDQMMSALTVEDEQDAALQGFDVVLAHRRPGDELNISTLLSKLLLLTDSPRDHTAELAAQVSSRIKILAASRGSDLVTRSSTELIADQLEGKGQALSILGLVELGQGLVEDAPETSKTAFPTTQHWQNALTPFLDISPSPISAIVSPLSGVVYAVTKSSAVTGLQRDSDDFTTALRLTLYATKLLTSTNIIELISQEQISGLYLSYPLALQLINNKLTLDSSNSIWGTSTPEVIEEMVELLSQGQALVAGWTEVLATNSRSQPADNSSAGTFAAYWSQQLDGSSMNGVTPRTYLLGLTFTSAMSQYVDTEGIAHFMSHLNDTKTLRSSDDIVRSASLIAIARDFLTGSPQGKRLCKELVADTTDLKDMAAPIPALRPLVLLNILLQDDEILLESIPTQRMVFLVKNLVRLLKESGTPYAIISEGLKALYHVIPSISEIYGEHWEEILEIITRLWDHENDLEDDLPVLHSSLKLYGRLKPFAKGATNEDLVDAWENASSSLVSGLLRVLKLFEEPVLGANQPRAITTDLLQRQLLDTQLPPEEIAELFPLMASEERSVQGAAYRLLHRAVPEAQQQISLDLVLENKITHLPEELMSLLLHAPSMQLFANAHQSRETLWMGVRRYLLSWNIVLDHFTNASYKLQERYVKDIKENGNLPPLLDFICEILRIPSGKPLDASRFDIKSYTLDAQESLEKEAQWLSVYLYYLCLLRLPSLVKDWFIEQKNRIKTPLESWTHKHFSPLLVSESLTTVSEWAAGQDLDDRPVTIKTSPKGSELVASIAIDEESPPISLAISLPGAYPLEQAVVTSRNRVGVSDKNWQSWMRTFQVIIFSTGSLIEGLVAFRRNVQGALKGQSECAICYSIIGTDMQTPNKTCGTCKNTFHSTCLYRWFKSSNSSSCPLCRNNFNYA